MKRILKTIILLVIFTAVNTVANSQTVYSLGPGPELKVSGTSTLHDWEMISTDATGEVRLTIANSKLITISSLTVILPARSLKSGKGQMDTNAYKALKADKFRSILFELTEVEKIADNIIEVTGKLTIAGTTRPINLKVRYGVGNHEIQFSGEYPTKFSEFNIDPPTAVFGTIKTGNDLKLSFNVTFKSTTKITKS